MRAINIRAVSLVRYGAGIIDWTQAELEGMDRKTRKLLTLYGAFHPKSSIERLYMKREVGGRGLLSIEDTVRVEEASLGNYVAGSEEQLLKLVKKTKTIKDETDPEQKRKSIDEARTDRFEKKKLHANYTKKVNEVNTYDPNDSWTWLKKGYLKRATEATIVAAQEQAIRTNAIKQRIDKTAVSGLCRMCGKANETISHILTECEVLAGKEYRGRHDDVARILHWSICKKYGLENSVVSYRHEITEENKIVENDDVKVLWDFFVQTSRKLDHYRPDLVVIHKRSKTCHIIDVACPFDTRIKTKEQDKIDRYQDLKHEILKCWKGEVKKASVIPVVIGALGGVTKNLKRHLKHIGAADEFETIQKTCLLGSARILRKVVGQE